MSSEGHGPVRDNASGKAKTKYAPKGSYISYTVVGELHRTTTNSQHDTENQTKTRTKTHEAGNRHSNLVTASAAAVTAWQTTATAHLGAARS